MQFSAGLWSVGHLKLCGVGMKVALRLYTSVVALVVVQHGCGYVGKEVCHIS
jgi:hypothetical protein